MYAKLDGSSRQIPTRSGPAIHRVYHVGPLPIIRHFLDRMGFSSIVSSCLRTPRLLAIDHAHTLSLLIANILMSPSPLYRIAEWAAPFSASALGLTPSQKDSINDDRAARSLDALVSVHARSLFFRLALHVIKHFEIDTRRIHHDTTTVTFHGQYASSFAEPRISRGHNKDHRPDLKQLVFGISVAADGAVPLSHEVYSGNRTDDTVHRGNVDGLRQLLQRDDFIYVADSKLATQKNLQHIASYGGRFVSVLPRSRAEDKLFRQQLRDGPPIRWRRFLSLDHKRRHNDLPDIYSSTTAGPQQTKEGYRLLWCRSSQTARHDADSRQTLLEKTRQQLLDLAARINRGRLCTRSRILRAANTILLDCGSKSWFLLQVHAHVQIQTRRLRRGRPQPGDPVRQVRSTVFQLDYKPKKPALQAEARCDGVFPIVTNIPRRRVSKAELLQIYKYQPYVEKRHSLLKTELEVAPVYLKKPHRAAGLIHAAFLAMTVDALIERTLRQAMIRYGIDALPILPEGRPSKTPTTARLLEMFSHVCWYEFERGDEILTFPINLTPLQKKLLHLLEIAPSTYA